VEFADHAARTDPAGHPFCIWPDTSLDASSPAIVRRLTFDCFSPRSLAVFYESARRQHRDGGHRGARRDLPDDARYPDFGFQHAEFEAARWPDPAYPAQFHVDFRFADRTDAAVERAERFGAIRLPKLADTEILADPAAHWPLLPGLWRDPWQFEVLTANSLAVSDCEVALAVERALVDEFVRQANELGFELPGVLGYIGAPEP
jgi:hypothetical protein